MPSFPGVNNPNIVVTVSDRDEVQVCPKCTFPNDAAARACADCGHPLQDGSGRWVPARLIRKCTNPACEAFVCTKDSKCKKCGHSTSADAEVITAPPSSAPTPASGDNTDATFVLICPSCNTHNPANADTCGHCGYSLEDVDPVCAGEEEKIAVQLENIRTKKRVSLTLKAGECTVIGYKGALADQFANTCYVSGTHFYLSYNEGTVWIRDESRNGTYIDGARLDKSIELPLFSNTIVGLGDPSASVLQAAFFKITY